MHRLNVYDVKDRDTLVKYSVQDYCTWKLCGLLQTNPIEQALLTGMSAIKSLTIYAQNKDTQTQSS